MHDVIVRSLGPDEWMVLRAVRLAALAENPDAFLTTWNDANAWPEDRWRAVTSTRAVAFAGSEPVGMVGWQQGTDHCELIGLWVRPDHRGGAIASTLVGHVLEVAGAPVELEVEPTNARALAFYRKVAFMVSPTPPTEAGYVRLRHP